ncbi:DUF3084 domain-containing protein [Chroococcidiopsis sp. TS-821]|uniref:DUF3084 domain-containing protein n=1 Tax=Chroococcidiopsis sp. TS-821 TaxID=1378066 RepID=UPI000CEF1AE7|nr:DUF3084 domain-containing protein [Chroococcidiopsis sp. TS-821]PPS39162.1 hypothetical protein B1A85_22475 [Chroococcidiopsis sp. TS-821]
MTTGYILIASILILGGVIATVGDRLGTRVGKARLSLFNLRPRNTAVLITILTGSIISASTLAILFAADERLRTGVFELEEIQSELRDRRQELEATRQQLEATTQEKTQVQQELAQARAERRAEQREAQRREAEAQQRLEAINESLQAARTQQAQTQAQLNRTQVQQSQTQARLNQTQEKLNQVSAQFQQAQARLRTVSQRARELRAEIQQVQSELQQLVEQRDQLKAQISQRDREIAKLDESITQRDRVIAQRESRLKQLEIQQNYLEQEAQNLERNLQVLRRGNVALFRGQVLAGGVVRIVDPKAARQAVDQLLGEANRVALRFTQPGIEHVNEQVVNISPAQVDQLIAQINDGRDYVVRIISAGNYVLGERSVQVIADAAQNQVVFRPGDVLAAISANPATMSDTELRQRVELLLGASNFRAQRAGILGDTIQIGDNRIETLIGFIEQLKQYNQAVEIQAVAAEVTYTAGPLKVELLATQNGQVIFRT